MRLIDIRACDVCCMMYDVYADHELLCIMANHNNRLLVILGAVTGMATCLWISLMIVISMTFNAIYIIIDYLS